MNPDQRWCVVSDGDGHSWLCPAERRGEALSLLEANEDFWCRDSINGETPPPSPDEVEWLRRIDGVHRLTFTDPQEGT